MPKENFDPLEEDFIEMFRSISLPLGIQGPFIKIFALVYLADEDIPLDEIAGKTGYSAASISSNVKLFENMGFFRKRRKPGSKKIYVSMEKNMLRLSRDALEAKELHAAKIADEKIPELISKYRGKKLSEEQKRKLARINEYHRQIMKARKILSRTIEEFDKAINDKK